jgi:hypothetical protein
MAEMISTSGQAWRTAAQRPYIQTRVNPPSTTWMTISSAD